MTDNTQALRDLLAAIEVGGELPRPLPFPVWQSALVLEAYRGSLDAAKALHDAVLPGWAVDRIGIWPGGSSSVRIVGTHIGHDGDRWHNFKDGEANGVADNAARAWLIAIIRALIAQAEQ